MLEELSEDHPIHVIRHKYNRGLGETARDGFEYVAVLPSDWIMERETQLDVARGGDGRVDPEQLDIPADPNEAIVAVMTPDEVAAYEFAYWGDADLGGDIAGCYQTTYEEVWGLDLLADLSTETAELERLLASDERLVAAEGEYLSCMRSDGFEVADFNDVHRLLDERFQLLKAEADARQAANERELTFLIVNETRKLVRARQVFVLRRKRAGRFQVKAVSSLDAVDRSSPLIRWIERIVRRFGHQVRRWQLGTVDDLAHGAIATSTPKWLEALAESWADGAESITLLRPWSAEFEARSWESRAARRCR